MIKQRRYLDSPPTPPVQLVECKAMKSQSVGTNPTVQSSDPDLQTGAASCLGGCAPCIHTHKSLMAAEAPSLQEAANLGET